MGAQQEGGESAQTFERVYREAAPAALRQAARFVPCPEAEDVVATVFTEVYRRWVDGWRPDGPLRAYVLASVRHEAWRAARRGRRWQSLDVAAPALPGEPGPEECVLEAEVLRSSLRALTPRQRRLLWVTAVEGSGPRDLVSQDGGSAGAWAAATYRARRRLREAYLDQHVDCAGGPTAWRTRRGPEA